MSKRIVIASPKGGAGKTTVSLNLALALAERGHDTLLVDLDPQGGIGHSLAKGDTELVGLADVFADAVTIADAVQPTRAPGLALLPRGRLDPIDVCEFELILHEPGRLEAVLDAADAGFEITLIDTPSGLGMATRAALRVADYVLVPLQAERLAYRSISQLLRVIDHVRAHDNPRLELLGVLPTMADKHREPSVAVLVDAWNDLASVLDTIVPRHEVFARASEAGVPLGFLGGAPSPEARRFDLLAEELEAAMYRLGGKELSHDRPQRALL